MQLTVNKQLKQEPNLWINKALTVLFIIGIMVWAGHSIEFNGLKENGVEIAKNVVDGIFHPKTSMLFTLDKGGVPALLLETICIALLGTLIGSIIAVPLSFLASSNIVPKWVSVITSFFIAAIRTFPAFVYGLMFIRVTGPGAFAGVLTLSVTSIGMVSKLFIETIEDLDKKY